MNWILKLAKFLYHVNEPILKSEWSVINSDSLRRSKSFTQSIMPHNMTATDIVRFIIEEGNAIIATFRKNGSPQTAWNPAAYVENKLYIYANPNSVCYENLIRDPRLSFAITSPDKAVFTEGDGPVSSNKIQYSTPKENLG
jgi:hypothetical protein